MTVHALNFEEVRYFPPYETHIDALKFAASDEINFGDTIGIVSVAVLRAALGTRYAITQGTCRPQLAAYLFAITRKPRLMNHYFPLARSFATDRQAEKAFYGLIAEIAKHKSFDLRLIDAQGKDRTAVLPPDAGFLVAGHIAEIFFFRRDLLEQFLSRRRGLLLYATPEVYKRDGGVAGGCYHPQRGAIMLVLSRLYEGFYEPTPGVATFIHEFGHMLDYASSISGMLPGMDEYMDWFRDGKKLELERYERQMQQPGSEPFPIGHPYVFQNNGEFIAGYLEMFFRNPHYFAAQNELLYQAFAQTLRQDPRLDWREDFPFYIQQNHDYYLSGKKPPKPGITIP